MAKGHFKPPAKCFRNLSGRRYVLFADYLNSDQEKRRALNEAKLKFSHVRSFKHRDGYYQLYVCGLKRYITIDPAMYRDLKWEVRIDLTA